MISKFLVYLNNSKMTSSCENILRYFILKINLNFNSQNI